MRSESTNALGQPRLTNPILPAPRSAVRPSAARPREVRAPAERVLAACAETDFRIGFGRADFAAAERFSGAADLAVERVVIDNPRFYHPGENRAWVSGHVDIARCCCTAGKSRAFCRRKRSYCPKKRRR